MLYEASGMNGGPGSGDSQACCDSGLGSALPLPALRGLAGPEPRGWSRGEGPGWGGRPMGPEGAPPSSPPCRCTEEPGPSPQVFPVWQEPWLAGHKLGGDS